MECIKPRYIHKNDVLVPCGSCAFCCATKRSDWALRLHYESRLHADKKFVTLTYADAHLKWRDNVPQLHKPHLQLWFKNIRRKGFKIRYYAVGEYGSRTFRPHYHIILFGSVPDQVIRDCWPFGLVHIGTVTDQSVMYTLGYIVNGKGWQMRTKRERPFAFMSLRPGIGANYLSARMIEWHKSDRKNYAMLNAEKRHLPRYYKEKIFSKVDLVRIAVRDQKAQFKKMVKWVRSPAMRRMEDPLAYRDEQLRQLACRIRAKCKENVSI